MAISAKRQHQLLISLASHSCPPRDTIHPLGRRSITLFELLRSIPNIQAHDEARSRPYKKLVLSEAEGNDNRFVEQPPDRRPSLRGWSPLRAAGLWGGASPGGKNAILIRAYPSG